MYICLNVDLYVSIFISIFISIFYVSVIILVFKIFVIACLNLYLDTRQAVSTVYVSVSIKAVSMYLYPNRKAGCICI